MSFEQSTNLESQPTNWRREDDPQYADDPEFREFTTELGDKLFTVTSTITRLSQQVALLGTQRESAKLRERVKDMVDETSQNFKEIGEGLKRVSQWPDLGPAQKFTQGKLNREFKASLGEFQVLQRTAVEKQRTSTAAARAALDDEATSPEQGNSGVGQQQQQEQLRLASQDEVDFQESLILQRESEIVTIEQNIGELNELFRDVAHMVHEQGEQLDTIYANVDQTRTDTQGAHKQLVSASRYQKNARSKACCLLLIISVILVIIILAVVID